LTTTNHVYPPALRHTGLQIKKIPDLLDFFITKGISPSYVNTTTSLDLSSDHTPIIAKISTTVFPKNPSPLSTPPKYTGNYSVRSQRPTVL
jgi:hypothetical protein